MKNSFIRNRKKHLAHVREVFFAVAVDSFVQTAFLSFSAGSKKEVRKYLYPDCTRIKDTDLDRAMRLLGFSSDEPDILTLLHLASYHGTGSIIRQLALRELFIKKSKRRNIALRNALARETPVIELENGGLEFTPEKLQWKIWIKKNHRNLLELTENMEQDDVEEIINVLSRIPVLGKFTPDLMRTQPSHDLSMSKSESYLQIIKELGNYDGPMITHILSEFLNDQTWEIRECAARALIQKAKEDYSQVMHNWAKISKLIKAGRSSEEKEIYLDSGSLSDCSEVRIEHTDTGIGLEIPPELSSKT
jgi:hypothetical protein